MPTHSSETAVAPVFENVEAFPIAEIDESMPDNNMETSTSSTENEPEAEAKEVSDSSHLNSTPDKMVSRENLNTTQDVIKYIDPYGVLNEDEDIDENDAPNRSASGRENFSVLMDDSLNVSDNEMNGDSVRLHDSFESNSTVLEVERRHSVLVLQPREIIPPEKPPIAGLRRSKRNRVMPLRSWLGEKAVYEHSPSGSRLRGVTEVEIKDPKMVEYQTADTRLIVELRYEKLRNNKNMEEEK
ncbi:unnamed protein product [Caenorhabditis bovis]|uniref:Uncharacterized protein n=1 Tax=Caenorhabditis bovis TaxID=2654633 RepID=A0A8S1F9W0_9PELO|nr:unnamed protein product [Caenorhabditis bovis]